MNVNDRNKVWVEVSHFLSALPFNGKKGQRVRNFEGFTYNNTQTVLYYSSKEMEEEYKNTLPTLSKLLGKRQRITALRTLIWSDGWDLEVTRNPGSEYKFTRIYQ